MLSRHTLMMWEAVEAKAAADGVPLIEALDRADFLRTADTVRRDRVEFYEQMIRELRDVQASEFAPLTPVQVRDAVVVKLEQLRDQLKEVVS